MEGQIALQYIAEQEGIPIANLRITNEHVRRYPTLSREFAAIAIIDDDAYLASLPRMRIIQGKETRRARCAAWSARSCSATRW